MLICSSCGFLCTSTYNVASQPLCGLLFRDRLPIDDVDVVTEH